MSLEPAFNASESDHDALPTYRDTVLGTGAPRPSTKHVFAAEADKGEPWFTLQLMSRASSASLLPYFIGGERVIGSITLNLNDDAKIKSVSIMITGDLILWGNDRYRIVSVSQQLWSPDKGYPDPVNEQIGDRRPHEFKGKLRGQFSWPFHLDLPHTVELKQGEFSQYELPASYADKRQTTRLSLVYRINAIVKRGMFNTEHTISTDVVYIPPTRPKVPSPARQLAYIQETPIPGPQEDPEGWHTLPTVTMHGKAFHSHDIAVGCMLSLAKPLSYTRGSSIPLSITLQSADPQALDLLSSPHAQIVRLQRIISSQYDNAMFSDLTAASTSVQSVLSIADAKAATSLKYEDIVDEVGIAVWWSESPPGSMESRASDDTRVLQGEVHLKPTLTPSSHLGHFKLSYAIHLMPSTVAGFIPSDNPRTPLEKCPVRIAALYAEGPRPITYSDPPRPDQPAESRYSIALPFKYN